MWVIQQSNLSPQGTSHLRKINNYVDNVQYDPISSIIILLIVGYDNPIA